MGDNFVGHALVALNQFGIALLRGLFSYQIFVRARALPTVPALLAETEESSAELKRAAIAQ